MASRLLHVKYDRKNDLDTSQGVQALFNYDRFVDGMYGSGVGDQYLYYRNPGYGIESGIGTGSGSGAYEILDSYRVQSVYNTPQNILEPLDEIEVTVLGRYVGGEGSGYNEGKVKIKTEHIYKVLSY